MSATTAGPLTSRQRLQATLNHQQPDRVCVDFGATPVTGIHVSAVMRLRQAVLGQTDSRVKVIEPYQMLGEVDDELLRLVREDDEKLLKLAFLYIRSQMDELHEVP